MNQSVVLFMDIQHDLVKNPLMTNADRQYTYYTKPTWLSSSQRGQLADHWLVSKGLECKRFKPVTVRKDDVCVVNCDMHDPACNSYISKSRLQSFTCLNAHLNLPLGSCAPNPLPLQRVTRDRRKWREAKTSCTKGRHERELTMPQDHCVTELKGSQGQEVFELLWSALDDFSVTPGM